MILTSPTSSLTAASSIPPLWPLLTIYLIWMWFDDAHESGGRRSEWVRRMPFFKYFAEYFPVRCASEVVSLRYQPVLTHAAVWLDVSIPAL